MYAIGCLEFLPYAVKVVRKRWEGLEAPLSSEQTQRETHKAYEAHEAHEESRDIHLQAAIHSPIRFTGSQMVLALPLRCRYLPVQLRLRPGHVPKVAYQVALHRPHALYPQTQRKDFSPV